MGVIPMLEVIVEVDTIKDILQVAGVINMVTVTITPIILYFDIKYEEVATLTHTLFDYVLIKNKFVQVIKRNALLFCKQVL